VLNRTAHNVHSATAYSNLVVVLRLQTLARVTMHTLGRNCPMCKSTLMTLVEIVWIAAHQRSWMHVSANLLSAFCYAAGGFTLWANGHRPEVHG
jgi:hypothetical protein